MFGYDYYTSDRVPPSGFVERLKKIEPGLECAFNAKRGIFEILRPRKGDDVEALHELQVHDPYCVIFECEETTTTPILNAQGETCAMTRPKDPGDWTIKKLRAMDTWKDSGWVDEFSEGQKNYWKGLDDQRDARNTARAEGMAHAMRKDLNYAQPRVVIGVNGTR